MRDSRAEFLKEHIPQLTANVTLYSTENGGRRTAAEPGWGCPCAIEKIETDLFYDGWPLLGDDPIAPGETRRLGWVFPFAGADILRDAGKFYLWEGRFIGEAVVVDDDA